GVRLTMPSEFLIWSGVAATVAEHVRSLQLLIVKVAAIPWILPCIPSLAPVVLPRAITICVPPGATDTLMMRALTAATAGVAGLGGGGASPPCFFGGFPPGGGGGL